VAADGARPDKKGEPEACQSAREMILNGVDWDCEVRTLFRDKNLGCKTAVSSGIDWFFRHEEQGIILEDDTLPDPTFFRFCAELLEYYRDDQRIMMISGDNFQFDRKRTDYSYYFSKYCHIWGWASWRRAWDYYDVNMKAWPEIKDKQPLFGGRVDKEEASYWNNIFERVYRGQIDTWDYQLLFACWKEGALSIVPSENLVSNIGYGNNGVHIKRKSIFTGLETKQVTFPLAHPPCIIRNVAADRYSAKNYFRKRFFCRGTLDRVLAPLNDLKNCFSK